MASSNNEIHTDDSSTHLSIKSAPKIALAAKITHIIDIEGFYCNGQILYKELAIINCSSKHVYKTSFRLGISFYDLSYKDRITNSYVYKNITGIPFQDLPYERFHQKDIKSVIKKYLLEYVKNAPQSQVVVAYKGGNIEKKLLSNMHIPHFNLEIIECPKFKDLVKDKRFYKFNDVNCNLHRIKFNSHRQRLHCAAEEIQVFDKWFDYFKQQNNI